MAARKTRTLRHRQVGSEQWPLASGLVIMTALVFIATNGHYNCSIREALSILLLIQH